MFKKLDHIAIVVRDTDDALKFYRDQLGLPFILSEVIGKLNVRLTHLDPGNVTLQLVQPLTEEHPLQEHLAKHGEGLHHLCLAVDDVPGSMAALPDFGLKVRPNEPHPGPRGKQAAFIDPTTTRGVQWEMTGPPADS